MQCTPCHHPTTRQPFTLIDTPGINHDDQDVRILLAITDLLTKSYVGWAYHVYLLTVLRTRFERTKVVQIVYLHRISDNRLIEPSLPSLRRFASFLTDHRIRIGSVVLATTMWHAVFNQEKAKRREDELCIEHWNTMIEAGCQVARFDRTFESAWKIVNLTNDTSDTVHEFFVFPGNAEGEKASERMDLYVLGLSPSGCNG